MSLKTYKYRISASKFGIQGKDANTDDPDLKHSWGTKNRGYKLPEEEDDEEIIPTNFFSFIANEIHYIFDFTNKEIYPKFGANGQYIKYPSMQYRTCTLPSDNACCIFLPMFKSSYDFLLGFFVRALIFSGSRTKEKEKKEGEEEQTEKIYNDTDASPVGFVSPIMLTETNMYPLTSGLTAHWAKTTTRYIRHYTSIKYRKYEESDSFVVSNTQCGKILNHIYQYELTDESCIHGWKNQSVLPGLADGAYSTLGLLRCMGWSNSPTFLGYMSAYNILSRGMLSINPATAAAISPIFYPSLIFYPIPYVHNNTTNYLSIGLTVETYILNTIQALTTINNSTTYDIANNNVIISPLADKKTLHLQYFKMKTIPLRPLCINVGFRGFLPYYIQQSF